MLEQLHTISDVLVERKYDLVDVLSTLSKFTASLAEAIASGPYFKVMLVNLLPYQILQPFVDAAFKKRGIDPEEFWRNAGLPAFRFPDPERRSASPTALRRRRRRRWKARPEHPGPAVRRGLAVLVHAGAGRTARPRQIRCRVRTCPTGPFGPNPYGAELRGARCRDVAAEPERPAASRRVCLQRPSPVSCRRIWVASLRRCRPRRRVRARCRWVRSHPRRAGLHPGRSRRCRRRSTDRRRRRDPGRHAGPAGTPPLPGNPPFLPPGSQG